MDNGVWLYVFDFDDSQPAVAGKQNGGPGVHTFPEQPLMHTEHATDHLLDAKQRSTQRTYCFTWPGLIVIRTDATCNTGSLTFACAGVCMQCYEDRGQFAA